MARAEWGTTDQNILKDIQSWNFSAAVDTEAILTILKSWEPYIKDTREFNKGISTDTAAIREMLSALGYKNQSGFRQYDFLLSINKSLKEAVTNTTAIVVNTSTIAEKTTKIAENSDSVITKLDEIIAALEALAESGSSSGGGSGSGTEIAQDWLKETTFTTARAEDNAATQEYRDWFKSAFGFGGSSSTPSMYDFFTSNSKFYYPWLAWSSYYEPSPFPVAGGTGAKWVEDYSYMSETKTYPNQTFIERFSHVLASNLNQVIAANEHFAINGAWNDWYAHTNLVANLWAIHNTAPTGESPTIGFADGVLTYKDGSSASGSSAPTTQTLDLNPVATNAYESVVGDITTLTEAVSSGTSTGDNPIDTDAIRARYFAYLDIQGASTDIGDDIRAASSSGETLKINFMGGSAELDLAAWGTSYRSIMTQERLRTWRGAMGIIWMLAAWCGGFYLVKRLGNME